MTWWVKHIFICLLAGFFLFFGIQILVAAYRLNNFFYFIMCFFSSNLMILISATIFFGFIYKMITRGKGEENGDEK